MRGTTTIAMAVLLLTVGGLGRADEAADGWQGLESAEAAPAAGASPGRTPAGSGAGFTLGRDNLGFWNPQGAARLGGMSGNCYAMAFAARLFFERVRFSGTGGSGGTFDLKAFARFLRAGGKGRFEVAGFASLHDMTFEPRAIDGRDDHPASGVGGDDALRDLGAVRRAGADGSSAPSSVDGLKTSASADPSPSPRRRAIGEVMKLVTTAHYLQYMQHHWTTYASAIVAGRNAAPATLTRRELPALEASLGRGESCLLLLWNVRQSYGHVVLGTGASRTATGVAIDVYDSNFHHGTDSRPRSCRIATDGTMAGVFSPAGEEYAGAGWFEKDRMALIRLPDPAAAPGFLAELGRKLEAADEATLVTLAAGELLHAVTRTPPETSSLRRNVTDFILSVQDIGSGRAGPHLDRNAAVEKLNAFLGRNTALAAKVALPYALPAGLSLRNVSVSFDARDSNRASISATVFVSRDASVHELATALSAGAAAGGPSPLLGWLSAYRAHVGSVPLRADVAFDLVKRRVGSSGTQAIPGLAVDFAPVPVVKRLHVTAGDLEPLAVRAGDELQLEISDDVLSRIFDALAANLGLNGANVSIGSGGYARLGSVRMQTYAPAKGTSRCRLIAAATGEAFIPVATANRGIVAQARPVAVTLGFSRKSWWPANRWALAAGIDARLEFRDGLGNFLVRALVDYAGSYLRMLCALAQGRLNQILGTSLRSVVTLVQPLELRDFRLSNDRLTADLGEAIVDLDVLARQLFGTTVQVELTRLDVHIDRIVLAGRFKRPATEFAALARPEVPRPRPAPIRTRGPIEMK